MVDIGNNQTGLEITNLLNKLIIIIGESENLTKSLKYVIEVMSDDTPENDLHQDALESLVFVSKQKVNGYRLRYDDISKQLNGLSEYTNFEEKFKIKIENTKQTCLNSLSENDETIKKLSSTAMKWEVGSSVVIKELREAVIKMEDRMNKFKPEFFNKNCKYNYPKSFKH
jgi:hypothetical protein